jgi:hypothetical protein
VTSRGRGGQISLCPVRETTGIGSASQSVKKLLRKADSEEKQSVQRQPGHDLGQIGTAQLMHLYKFEWTTNSSKHIPFDWIGP